MNQVRNYRTVPMVPLLQVAPSIPEVVRPPNTLAKAKVPFTVDCTSVTSLGLSQVCIRSSTRQCSFVDLFLYTYKVHYVIRRMFVPPRPKGTVFGVGNLLSSSGTHVWFRGRLGSGVYMCSSRSIVRNDLSQLGQQRSYQSITGFYMYKDTYLRQQRLLYTFSTLISMLHSTSLSLQADKGVTIVYE